MQGSWSLRCVGEVDKLWLTNDKEITLYHQKYLFGISKHFVIIIFSHTRVWLQIFETPITTYVRNSLFKVPNWIHTMWRKNNRIHTQIWINQDSYCVLVSANHGSHSPAPSRNLMPHLQRHTGPCTFSSLVSRPLGQRPFGSHSLFPLPWHAPIQALACYLLIHLYDTSPPLSSLLISYVVACCFRPATCSCWFLTRRFFYPEGDGDMFLQNAGSHKNYMASHPKKRHSSSSLLHYKPGANSKMKLHFNIWEYDNALPGKGYCTT
jgi:hypothetical protein